eukprot:scaffold24327_cov21-Tisochrysis_lutea.AAC.2
MSWEAADETTVQFSTFHAHAACMHMCWSRGSYVTQQFSVHPATKACIKHPGYTQPQKGAQNTQGALSYKRVHSATKGCTKHTGRTQPQSKGASKGALSHL